MPRARATAIVVLAMAGALWGCPSLDGISSGGNAATDEPGGPSRPLGGDAAAPLEVPDASPSTEVPLQPDEPPPTPSFEAGLEASLGPRTGMVACTDPAAGCGPSRVPCGTGACIAPDAICCVGANEVCLPNTPDACDSPTEAPKACDDASDCPGGQVCCIELSLRLAPAPLFETRCAPSCPLSPQACHTNTECGADPCVRHTCQIGLDSVNVQVCDRLLTKLCGP
jgi:hypothetical protein